MNTDERDSWCERDAELVRGGTASSTTERLAPALGTAVDRLVDSFLVAAPVTFDRLPRFGSRSRFGSHFRSASSRHSSGTCRHSSTTTPVHRRAPPGRRDPPQSAAGKSHLTLKLRYFDLLRADLLHNVEQLVVQQCPKSAPSCIGLRFAQSDILAAPTVTDVRT